MKKLLSLILPVIVFATPNNPSDLKLIPQKNAVEISWSDNANSESGYKIYRDDKLIFIAPPNTKSYIDSGLEEDHTYYYTIKATDDNGIESKGDYFTQSLTHDKHLVISDKKLMWVNDGEYDHHGCLAVHGDRDGDYEKSVTFCQDLDFAGFDDWRDPTSNEMRYFIFQTNRLDIETGYIAPCNALLTRESNSVEKIVSTRFNSDKDLATVEDYVPYRYNVGLRCVRDR